MFDTMTITKAAGAFCAALLVFLLAGWAAEGVYNVEVPHGEDHVSGFRVEVPEAGGEDVAAEAEPEVPFEEVFASASAEEGERVWRQCSACHALNGNDGVGPHLNGVVGRDIASIDGFSYSDALSGLEGNWEPEDISHFITNPREYAPGTAMSYGGLGDIEDRANLIAYLQTQ